MKYLIRYCSVFLCLVLLFTAFSITASAETVEIKDYHVSQQHRVNYNNSWIDLNHPLRFYPNNGTVEKSEKVSEFTYFQFDNMTARTIYTIKYTNDDIMLQGGKTYKVSLNNIYYSYYFTDSNGNNGFYVRKPVPHIANIYYTDGTTEAVKDIEIVHVNNETKINFELSFSPSKDVKQIQIFIDTDFKPYFNSEAVSNPSSTWKLTTYCGEYNGDDKFQFALEVESQEAGLLKSVIEWLKSIKEGITNLFQSIAELPSKLWQLIENGLKSLFVPDEQFLIDFKNDIETMLSEKLGAVYQVVDIIADIGERISANDVKNTITIPSVSIPLPSGDNFSFGGYEVKIVHDKFSFLADMVKTAVGIASTVLFVNGLRKKYDDVIGGS